MELPNSQYTNSEAYRYGFNGKENDKEWGTASLTQDYGFRLYNPAIAKFLSVDPLSKEYPWNSTYAFAENDVIRCIDLEGAEKFYTFFLPPIVTPRTGFVAVENIISAVENLNPAGEKWANNVRDFNSWIGGYGPGSKSHEFVSALPPVKFLNGSSKIFIGKDLNEKVYSGTERYLGGALDIGGSLATGLSVSNGLTFLSKDAFSLRLLNGTIDASAQYLSTSKIDWFDVGSRMTFSGHWNNVFGSAIDGKPGESIKVLGLNKTVDEFYRDITFKTAFGGLGLQKNFNSATKKWITTAFKYEAQLVAKGIKSSNPKESSFWKAYQKDFETKLNSTQNLLYFPINTSGKAFGSVIKDEMKKFDTKNER